MTGSSDDRLEPLARSLLEPGENLRGCCVATQQSLLSGRMVAIVVADDRLIVQGLTRRFEPAGEPLSLPPSRIADVRDHRRRQRLGDRRGA